MEETNRTKTKTTNKMNMSKITLAIVEMMPSYKAYMSVEDVLGFLGKKALPVKQYQIEGQLNHVFKVEDLKKKIDGVKFRSMECAVTQYLIEMK